MMRYFRIAVASLAALFLLTPFTAVNLFFDSDLWIPQYYTITIGFMLIVAITLFLILKKTTLQLNLNAAILSVFALYLYIVIRFLFTPYAHAYFSYAYILGLFLIVTYSIRVLIIPNQLCIYVIIFVFLISGAIEGIYGFMQLTGLYVIKSGGFIVLGTFNNSGSYANYLVVVFVFAIGFFLYFKQTGYFHKLLRYFSLIVAVIILSILPFTGARTSWIAAAIGITVVYWPIFKQSKWFTLMFGNAKRKSLSLILLGMVAIIISLSLFNYKIQSSRGRLLIYEVSLTMIKQKPVFGFGFCRFPAEYNNYQGAYFKENQKSKYAIVADNTKTCFNEFLQIWVELGLIGLVLFAGTVICIFRCKPKSGKEHLVIPAKAALFAVLICSCFSYPLRTLPIGINIIILIAIIYAASDFKIFAIKLPKVIYLPLALIISFAALLITHNQVIDLNARRMWSQAIKYAQSSNYNKAIPLYREVYPTLNYDGNFLYNYGAELSEIDTLKSIHILEEAAQYLSDSDLCTYLGDDYYAIKNYLRAEQYYIHSQNITPNRFYPRYQLFKLYCETEQFQKAHAVAQTISKMNVKIPSGTVFAIKEEIKQWLIKYNLN